MVWTSVRFRIDLSIFADRERAECERHWRKISLFFLLPLPLLFRWASDVEERIGGMVAKGFEGMFTRSSRPSRNKGKQTAVANPGRPLFGISLCGFGKGMKDTRSRWISTERERKKRITWLQFNRKNEIPISDISRGQRETFAEAWKQRISD